MQTCHAKLKRCRELETTRTRWITSYGSSIKTSHHAYAADQPFEVCECGLACAAGVIFLVSRNRDSSREHTMRADIRGAKQWNGMKCDPTKHRDESDKI